MGLSDIVSVEISVEAKAVSQQGFGTMLIVGPNPTFDRIQYFSGSSALADLAALLTGTTGADEYKAAQYLMGQSPKPVMFAVGRKKSGDADYSAALTAIQEISNDWYGFMITSRTQADQLNAAVWAGASVSPKIFCTASAEADAIGKTLSEEVSTPSSTPYKIKATNNDRACCVYSGNVTSKFPDAAILGVVATRTPGSYTLKFKTLGGVTSDDLTTTQSKNAHDKLCNTFEPVGGVDIVQNGEVSGTTKRFLDVVIGVDWLQSRMTERVFSVLVNSEKVPFTDAGVESIVTLVKAQLQEGIDVGLLASDPAPVVTAPLVADVSTNDKANRTLPDIEFSAVLAGAIHSVTIAGKVSV